MSDNTKILTTDTFTTTLDNSPSTTHTSSLFPNFSDEETFNTPERKLWRSVIGQALVDAASNSHKPEARYHKKKAIEWLTGEDPDFISVCTLADLDPGYVKEKAKAAIADAHANSATIMQRHHAKKKSIAKQASSTTIEYKAHNFPMPCASMNHNESHCLCLS